MQDYLKIKYRNSCDLGGSVFQSPLDGFYYVLYLDVDVGKPEYETVEEGREDGDKNFIRDFRKQTKRYEFTTIAPEYLFDALSMIQMHDTIFITTKYEEDAEVLSFVVQNNGWTTDGDICNVTITFTVRYDLTTNCCNNELLQYTRCLECSDLEIEGFSYEGSDYWDNPGTYYRDQSYVLFGTLEDGVIYNFTLYFFDYESGLQAVEVNSGVLLCYSSGGVDYYWYYSGGFWHYGQLIKSVANSGADVIVKGYCFPDTWALLYISTDGITYASTGSVTQGDTFEELGVTVGGLTPGLTYYFKFLMYNNNCNYGYSNVETIVKT